MKWKYRNEEIIKEKLIYMPKNCKKHMVEDEKSIQIEEQLYISNFKKTLQK